MRFGLLQPKTCLKDQLKFSFYDSHKALTRYDREKYENTDKCNFYSPEQM